MSSLEVSMQYENIPYGKHQIIQDDIDSVLNVLRNQNLTQGDQVPKFEKLIASKVSANYAVAVNSATSALHLECLALDVSSDDYVWTSPISFVASANCALYCGAKIDFVDIDPLTGLMSLEGLKNKIDQFDKWQNEVSFDEISDPLESIWCSDVVLGMSSNLLVEAMILEKPVISILPRVKEIHWMSALETNAIKSIFSRTELRVAFNSLANENYDLYKSPFIESRRNKIRDIICNL